jgi:hypothetical protein
MSDAQYVPPPSPPSPPPPPPPVLPPALPPGPQFDFAKPFTYVFDDPRWLQKILIGGLFYLAGFLIIGWFFIFGYMARVARNVAAGAERPLPEWEDLGGFFNEGLRLVGVVLVYIIPMIALAVVFMVPAGILEAYGSDAFQVLGSGLAGCMACLFVPLSLLVLLFLPASLLFAAMEQRFAAAFEFGRIWPFIKSNIGNYLLAIVVHLVARFLGGFGIMLLCIGVIFTGFWAFLVSTHAFSQVYRLAPKG